MNRTIKVYGIKESYFFGLFMEKPCFHLIALKIIILPVFSLIKDLTKSKLKSIDRKGVICFSEFFL